MALTVEGEGRFVDLIFPPKTMLARPLESVPRHRKRILQVAARQTSPGTVSAFCPVGSIRSTQIPGARSPGRLNFVHWHLMFVVFQYGTSLMSLFWCLEF